MWGLGFLTLTRWPELFPSFRGECPETPGISQPWTNHECGTSSIPNAKPFCHAPSMLAGSGLSQSTLVPSLQPQLPSLQPRVPSLQLWVPSLQPWVPSLQPRVPSLAAPSWCLLPAHRLGPVLTASSSMLTLPVTGANVPSESVSVNKAAPSSQDGERGRLSIVRTVHCLVSARSSHLPHQSCGVSDTYRQDG